jgi:ATP-dependent helicase/DNAse subunit B
MRLITGPAGSGKTHFVLETVRAALRSGDRSLRVLVPTATLAQHLQNRLAREGFLIRGNLVQTLHGFVDPWAGGATEVPPAALYLIVEDAVRRVNRPEFERVARLPGFCTTIAGAIQELSAAGCSCARLARQLPSAPLAAAFLAVYREVEAGLERRVLSLRAARLERAAETIERDGAGGISAVLLDGFHALPDPELRVISALDKRADVSIALADEALAGEVSRLVGNATRVRLERARTEPAKRLFRARSVEREVEEIARRILEQAAEGRAFREIGIVARAADAYEPALRSTLSRFGIPARFYFDSALEAHPAVRFLAGAVEAMLAGWDHEQTLAVLRLAPRFAASLAMDRFDFEVRRQIPGKGLGGLKAFLVDEDGQPVSADARPLLRKIDRIGAIEEWRSFELAPCDWAERMRSLRGLFRPARPADGATHERALEWRGQSDALAAFEDALAGAALALDPGRRITLADFWRAVKPVLRLTPLRASDGRRNVVHVLSAHEARQWELPVVFVCGMTEKQFPMVHRQDPFFPDGARRSLQRAGIRVRTAEDFEKEERALFDSAAGRATGLLTLSYAEFDAEGNPALPSLFLQDLGLAAEACSPLRPRPAIARPAPAPETGAPAIVAPDLLNRIAACTRRLSPSGLETFLRCPFQYFAGRLLRLGARPSRPEDRLDAIQQGEIVHQTLKEWYAHQGDMRSLFEEIYLSVAEQASIPVTFAIERIRQAMREDLENFAKDARWPRSEFQSQVERDFEFPLEDLTIAGKIDRLDAAADQRAYVIDYKYSNAESVRARLEDETRLQAELYLLAAERQFALKPAGMFYVALKGEVKYFGWSSEPVGGVKANPAPEGWLEKAAEQALRAAAEIRSGRVAPAPFNAEICDRCEYCDVCRFAAVRAEDEAEEAEA